uniref:C-type lectin domain-containing protein n=1 Tax=Erpetoichthys calabaricus TaxID=27687 RepID=A0A8C4XE25_ERPCA
MNFKLLILSMSFIQSSLQFLFTLPLTSIYLGALLLFCFTGKTYPYCSESWVLFNASCYFFSTDKLDWNASRNNCTSIGGHLVIIDSEEDYSSSWDKSYWIGLTDQKTEGHFLWMNNKHLDENKM